MASFTQNDLDLLNKAIAQGARTVKYADQEVTYNSLTDMLRARTIIMEDLGLSSGGGIQKTTGVYNKGL